MHELSIAKELSDIVSGVAEKEKLKRVTEINVCFGKMIQVVPEIFRFALEETVKGTVSEGAVINIEILPVILLCLSCNNEFGLEENAFVCDKCNSSDVLMKQGKEIFVKSIEGE